MARTFAWIIPVALVSGILGVFISRNTRPLRGSWWWLVMAAMIPPFAMFHAVWSRCATDAFLARPVCLAASLVVWGTALSALISSIWSRSTDADDLTALDGATWFDIVRLEFVRRAPAACAGAAAVALVLFGESTAFDLAQVRTVAFELKALAALGVSLVALIQIALPLLIALMVCSILVGRGMAGWTLRTSNIASMQGKWTLSTKRAIGPIILGLIPVISILCARNVWEDAAGLRAEHLRGIGWSISAALCASIVLGSFAAVATTMMAQSIANRRGRWILIVLCSSIVLFLAAVPAAILSSVLLHTADLLFETTATSGWWLVVLGHSLRAAAVVWCIALFAAVQWDRSASDAAALRGGATSFAIALWPTALRVFLSSALIVFVLSFGDVSVAGALEPAGADRLATRLIDALHYQRPGPIAVLLPLVGCAAVIAATVMAIISKRVRTLHPCIMVMLFLPLILAGCAESGSEHSVGSPLSHPRVIGAPGRANGLFEYPRALAVDPRNGDIIVIDKTARVQRFHSDGSLDQIWMMPRFEQGKPTGVSVAPDGRVFVADTHEHRVLIFSSDGKELFSLGQSGTGPGEFIYPTDIAFRSDGRILVSEYGGNDRIQEFTHDGKWIRSFGERGDPGPAESIDGIARFDRPQSILLDEQANRIYVADACHHRIVELTGEGEFVRSIGEAGVDQGQLWYPYGVDRLDEHTLVVCEFGANRLQRLDLKTAKVGPAWGRSGSAVGELAAPWSVAVWDGHIIVCDGRNGRVQVVSVPSSEAMTGSDP